MDERTAWRFCAFVFGPGAVLLLALCVHAAFQAYVRGHCAAVFGCAGGVMLAASIGGLAWFGSSLAASVVWLFQRGRVCALPRARLAVLVGTLGAAQTGLILTLLWWPLESINAMLAVWSVVCGIGAWLGLRVCARGRRGGDGAAGAR